MKETTHAGDLCLEHIAAGASATNKKGVVLFTPGTGESKTEWAKTGKPPYDAMRAHGPGKFLARGWEPDYLSLYCVQSPAPFFDVARYDKWIDALVALPHVDPDRIYLTALSAGAIMQARYLGSSQRAADRVAAFVGFSGNWPVGIEYSKNVPIWSITGRDDAKVLPGDVIADMKRMIDAGQPNKKLNVMPGGHTRDFWETFYSPFVGLDGHKNIYRWMAQFRRNGI